MRAGFSTLLLLSAAASLLTGCASFTYNPQEASPTKVTPTITWNQPAPIDSATPLGPAQLDATANVSGTFAYSPTAGTMLPAGSHVLSATFTPTDTADYNTAKESVTLQVNAVREPVGSSNCASGTSTSGTDFVYVSTGAWKSSSYQIAGYSSNLDGSLTPVPGSPFATLGGTALKTVGTCALLFGTDWYTVYSYGVHSDGSLSLENSTIAGQGPQNNPWALPMYLFLDPPTANLYSFNFVPAEESYYASYSYDASTGAVTLLANTDTNMTNDGEVLAFDPSGQYAVSSSCTVRAGMATEIFQRGGNGALSQNATFAPHPDMGQYSDFCSEGAAADHEGHFMFAGFNCIDIAGWCNSYGPFQLAVYTMDASGNMTTASTPENMPVLDVINLEGGITSYQFSPDDRYFAVTGFTGLEVFAWDTAKAIFTHVASLNNTEGNCWSTSASSGCTGNGFGNIAWDSYDHLYTLLGNQLFVYTVTDSGISQAPGSPHTVQNPQWVTVVNETSH